MKNLKYALALSMILCSAARAAGPSCIYSKAQTPSSANPSITITGVAIGDTLIVVPIAANGPASVSASSVVDAAGDTATTDETMTGIHQGTTYISVGFYSIRNVAHAGSHAITVALNGAVNSEIFAADCTGMGSGPTVDVLATAATGTSASPSSNSITTTANGDLLIAAEANSSNSVTTSGWTNSFVQIANATSVPNSAWASQVQATAAAITASVTLSSSQNWRIDLIAYKPGGGASCTHAGITSAGATAIPNGSSGSYWLKNGSFGAPDCSTLQYWQPALGNFGAN